MKIEWKILKIENIKNENYKKFNIKKIIKTSNKNWNN